MIVRDSQQLDECRNSFFRSVGSVVEIANDKTSSYQSVAERISDLKVNNKINILATYMYMYYVYMFNIVEIQVIDRYCT